MRVLIPTHCGSHTRALALWVTPMLEARGHTVTVACPTHRHQREIGDLVSSHDILVTTTPWWCYINMWVAAARHFGKLWVYHPEGWDNVHPLIHPAFSGHEKSQGWPYKPDRLCAHGDAMARKAIEHRKLDPETIRLTGGPRFDVYGTHWLDIMGREPGPFGDPERPYRPIILICSAALWDHSFIVEALVNRGYRIVIRLHQADFPDRYDHLRDRYGVEVRVPQSVDVDDPEPEHGYDPTVQDLVDYARELAFADVVVNVAGTPTLEALILGTPVVNIGCLPDEARVQEHQKLFLHYGPGSHWNDIKAGETSYLASTLDAIPTCVEEALTAGSAESSWAARQAPIRAMLKDVLSIDYAGYSAKPIGGAASRVCDVIEELQ